jgi:hypothetical protein
MAVRAVGERFHPQRKAWSFQGFTLWKRRRVRVETKGGLTTRRVPMPRFWRVDPLVWFIETCWMARWT